MAFTGIGLIGAGIFITKFKPTARRMAAWNVFGGAITAIAFVIYLFLGCNEIENTLIVHEPLRYSIHLQLFFK